MSDEVESGQSPIPISPQIKIEMAEYSVAKFAESLVDFYNALVNAGIEKSFAQRLTVAFCQRP